MLPARLRVAVADVPDETRGTLDSVVLPSRKLTDPAGAADPLAGFTVAVSVVLAVVRMAAGAADRSVVVAITGCVTAIVVVAAEPALAGMTVDELLQRLDTLPAAVRGSN